jgi:hypothetical protein
MTRLEKFTKALVVELRKEHNSISEQLGLMLEGHEDPDILVHVQDGMTKFNESMKQSKFILTEKHVDDLLVQMKRARESELLLARDAEKYNSNGGITADPSILRSAKEYPEVWPNVVGGVDESKKAEYVQLRREVIELEVEISKLTETKRQLSLLVDLSKSITTESLAVTKLLSEVKTISQSIARLDTLLQTSPHALTLIRDIRTNQAKQIESANADTLVKDHLKRGADEALTSTNDNSNSRKKRK